MKQLVKHYIQGGCNMNKSKEAYEHCMAPFYVLNGYTSDKYKDISEPFYMILYLANIGWNRMPTNTGLAAATRYVESKLNGDIVDGC
jgi:hypothetical protein